MTFKPVFRIIKFMIRLFRMGLSPTELLAALVAFVLAIMISLMARELLRAYLAVWFGDKTPKLTKMTSFNPARHFDPVGLVCIILTGFGWGKGHYINPQNMRKPRRNMFTLCLCVLLFSFFVSFFFYPLQFLSDQLSLSNPNWFFSMLSYFCLFMTLFNLGFFIFHLFPFFPLESFNVVRCCIRNPNNKFLVFNAKYGQYVVLGIIIALSIEEIYSYIIWPFYQLFYLIWGGIV